MKFLKPVVTIIPFLCCFYVCTSPACAQDSLITKLAKANMSAFRPEGSSFVGQGWDNILKKIETGNNVLIGEEHFTAEVPLFTSALASEFKFDNFFAEIDPYTAQLLETKIQHLSAGDLDAYIAAFKNTFSFYTFEPDFALLKQLVARGTKIRGTDQIMVVGDRTLASELERFAANTRVKAIFKEMNLKSNAFFEEFLKDQSKPFYMLTPDFDKQLDELVSLPLNDREREIAEALKISTRIYKTQSHALRIQLMKHQLMNVYADWAVTKNLFRYGANHAAKGESLLEIYDVGNLVHNIDEANYKNSVHIMVMGRSGAVSAFFPGLPDSPIQPTAGGLKILTPFLNAVTGNDWVNIDLAPIKKAINEGKLIVNDLKLARIVKGYDMLVLVPRFHPAKRL